MVNQLLTINLGLKGQLLKQKNTKEKLTKIILTILKKQLINYLKHKNKHYN